MENLFRKNQHKLNERPSARTWERLESRLDDHRRRGRVTMIRQWSMAAAVLLLIGVVSLLGTFGNLTSDNAPIADSQMEYLNVSPSEQAESVEQIRRYQDKLYAVKTVSVAKARGKKELQTAKWVQQ